MEIKVLGTGCAKCKALEKLVIDFTEKNQIEANIIKEEDIKEIIKYTMTTPALMVNGVVVLKGKIPTQDELGILLNR